MFKPPPNQTDYLAFLRGVVAIAPQYLPNNAPVIEASFCVALDIVSGMLAAAAPQMYTLAVYNLAADRLINYAPDPPGQCYFQKIREGFKVYAPNPGIVSSTSDESTSSSYLNPDFMKQLTLMDLANLRTPYGRQYLEIAQNVGTLWGLT